ncbi:Similar to slc46a1: Proton-coupled folate transporter (Danio rerio) [Cotesia congregata]|uniref:Similar to slc46a1: Proton-coupled folate transporter (Danio rerio) n=1 Tax=Cotesia congregata TaxID=51543 RepID=A0A8J2HMX2_COTCN|nr:Similar to slc46a1: Proton-coupled folate transporter (Danio rerio) [Cotesia congregata]
MNEDLSEIIIVQNRRSQVIKKFFGWIRYISVEPTMWLYIMAYMMTSVVEQALFVDKSCRVNHGFSEEVCRDIKNNDTINKIVQVTVSDFHQWNNIAGHVVPIILSLFYGNWSDRRGRKLPLIIGLLGKIIYSGMIVVNTLKPNWDLFMIIYTASIPMGMLGGDLAIFGSCFAYISDVSSAKQRTLRVTILEIAYLSTMPTGIALGSYLFTEVFNRSYTIMFAINTTLLIISVIYSLIVLKWQTNPRQTPLLGVNVLKDFFDKEHVISTVKTLTKPRSKNRRLHLWMLFIAMTFYTFQRDEKPMSYLYTQRIFQWDVSTFSKFRTFQSSFFVAAMLIGGPILSKLLGLRDTIIVMIGALSHAAGRVFFASATTPEIFYAGAAVAAIGPVVAPVLRSMTSKVVPINERGKVFAMLSVCDNAVPFFSGVLYSQLYNETYNTVPSAIYWLTFATQIAVLLLILVIHLSSGSNQREKKEEAEEEEEEETNVSEAST